MYDGVKWTLVSQFLRGFLLILITAVSTHLVMSFGQTLMHYTLGHHAIGGKFFRNHINFHHVYDPKEKLVSPAYLKEEDNNTPFFFILICLVGVCTYFILPVDLFIVQVIACAASFYHTSFLTRNIMLRDHGFSALRGSDECRNFILLITDMQTAISR